MNHTTPIPITHNSTSSEKILCNFGHILVSKLRQNETVRDYFQPSLALITDNRFSDDLIAYLLSKMGIKASRTTIKYWRIKGRTPYEELKILAVIYLAWLVVSELEKKRRFIQALKEPTDKMAESEPSLTDALNYFKGRGETLGSIAESVSESLPDSIDIDPRNLSNWLAGKPPRKQKASNLFMKDADAFKEAMGPEGFARLLSRLDKIRGPNAAEIALKARYAEETGLSYRVRNELDPLFAHPIELLMSADDLNKQFYEMVDRWKSEHGSTK